MHQFTKHFLTVLCGTFIIFGHASAQGEPESGTGATLPEGAQPPGTVTTEEAAPEAALDFDPSTLPSGEPALDQLPPEVRDNVAGMEAETETTPTEEGTFSYRRIVKWGGVLTSILLIIVILMQETSSGLSSTFGGGGGVYTSKRGVEKVLFRTTIVLAILFGLLNFLAMAA